MECLFCLSLATKIVYPDKDPLDVAYCCENHIVDSFTDHERHTVLDIDQLVVN